MSTNAAPVADTNSNASPATNAADDKGKTKAQEPQLTDEQLDDEEEEDDDDDDDDDMEDDDEEDDDDDDDAEEKIDPTAILPRRTRGVKVDYSSAEAHSKAGLSAQDDGDEDVDPDVSMS